MPPDLTPVPLSPVPACVAVFDLDRTVTRAGTFTPFLLHCMPSRPAAAQSVLAALVPVAAYRAGLLTRGELKARMLACSIAGASRSQVADWAADFVTRWTQSHLRPGAGAAIARHRAAGHHLVLATASFDFYARLFAERLGFDHLIATTSVWDEAGRLCARLDGENCYGPAKLAAVQSYLGKLPVPPRVVAYSDHHTDLALLSWAHEGVAVNPNRKLCRAAKAHHLSVVDWDKV